MKSLKYIVYKEGEYYVSQCLNVDVSSFGDTLQDALELYFEDNIEKNTFPVINETIIGKPQLYHEL